MKIKTFLNKRRKIMTKQRPVIKQETLRKVINAAIGYLGLVIEMLEELRDGKNVEIV